MPELPTPLHETLASRGVTLVRPETIDIGEEVDPARISGDGVVIHPGCRIHGASTLIGPGCELGGEAPMTIDGCALGARVKLKGGYAAGSVFLDDASVGSSAQIREACLLEEESGAAHACGLKQTILFPYVQLGSVINFCETLLAGGTNRHDHSEVGSGYIHFNFTPRGDKATASTFGDVPRGVFLRSARIFLGGQGGTVGPVRVGFGTVVAAGLILRDDLADGAWLTEAAPHAEPTSPPSPLRLALPGATPAKPHSAPGDLHIRRIVSHGINYLAQLGALRTWYDIVRRPYFEAAPLGAPLLDAALAVIDAARKERAKRLREFAGLIAPKTPARQQFADHAEAVTAAILAHSPRLDEEFIDAAIAPAAAGTGYLDAIKALPFPLVPQGQSWLNTIVGDICRDAVVSIPALDVHPWRGISSVTGAHLTHES